MKIGRLNIEHCSAFRWLEFRRIPLYCGCWRFAVGPFTLEYVLKMSKCYPHTECTNGRIVMYCCGHEIWSGWGIPQPELGEPCCLCRLRLSAKPDVRELHCSELIMQIELGKGNE
jgi:hypothetical protein